MSNWPIESFKRVGPLHFGMRQPEVAATLGEPGRRFKKGMSDTVTEAYKNAGVHVYYDGRGSMEFVELFPPAQPIYDGVELMRSDSQAVLQELALRGIKPRDDGDGGIWFDDHGFALYSPGGRTEGISVFRRGYNQSA